MSGLGSFECWCWWCWCLIGRKTNFLKKFLFLTIPCENQSRTPASSGNPSKHRQAQQTQASPTDPSKSNKHRQPQQSQAIPADPSKPNQAPQSSLENSFGDFGLSVLGSYSGQADLIVNTQDTGSIPVRLLDDIRNTRLGRLSCSSA